MSGLLLDTHAVLWFAFDDPRLSETAAQAIEEALAEPQAVFVSVISLVEMVYLAEKGRIPKNSVEMIRRLEQTGGLFFAPLVDETVAYLSRIDRNAVPDMPDRLIAATALQLDLPLVTCDEKIRHTIENTIW